MIWNVVALSSPVEISSKKSVFLGLTSNSPVVTRFLCPPLTPLIWSFPIRVSEHTWNTAGNEFDIGQQKDGLQMGQIA